MQTLPDDWDVVYNGRDIGRIFNAQHGLPPDQLWMWSITGALVKPSHGFCATKGWVAACCLTNR